LTVAAVGRVRQLCPGNSDLDPLSNIEGIVDLNTEIASQSRGPARIIRVGSAESVSEPQPNRIFKPFGPRQDFWFSVGIGQ